MHKTHTEQFLKLDGMLSKINSGKPRHKTGKEKEEKGWHKKKERRGKSAEKDKRLTVEKNRVKLPKGEKQERHWRYRDRMRV